MSDKSSTAMENRKGTGSALRDLPGVRMNPLSENLGMDIRGIDLAADNPDSVWRSVKQAFLDHHVLVFRDQNVDDGQFAGFARHFGETQNSYLTNRALNDGVQYVSNLDAQGNPVATPAVNGNYFWHTDQQYYPKTSLLTMLGAIELPPEGGDTEFANMIAAYEALPQATRDRIDGLRAVYSYQYMIESCAKRPATRDEIEKAPPVIHPLVRTHPETGLKSLFIGSYCSEIVGMSQADGRQLIRELFEFATQKQFVYRHLWRPGDLVLWDNRCLIHRAIANFEMGKYRRVMRRIVVKGSAPF